MYALRSSLASRHQGEYAIAARVVDNAAGQMAVCIPMVMLGYFQPNPKPNPEPSPKPNPNPKPTARYSPNPNPDSDSSLIDTHATIILCSPPSPLDFARWLSSHHMHGITSPIRFWMSVQTQTLKLTTRPQSYAILSMTRRTSPAPNPNPNPNPNQNRNI